MDRLEKLINELEIKIPNQNILNKTVSKSSVGWHIEHTLLTIILVIEKLKKSLPTNYKWKFNFKRYFVFTLNKIPRGIGKSPNAVKPKNDFNSETLKKHIGIAKEKIIIISSLKNNNNFEHPYFGKLNLKPTIKFLCIHTKHHIEIMNDIIKSG